MNGPVGFGANGDSGPAATGHGLNCQPELGNPCIYCMQAKTT
jgi:hypothetical protein